MKLIEFKANPVLAVQDDVIEIDPARRVTVAQEERESTQTIELAIISHSISIASKDPVSPLKL